MLDDAVGELIERGRLTRERVIREYGEECDIELRRHPGVAEREVLGEPGYGWESHDGPVTVYTIWVGGEPHVQTVDPGVAESCASIGCPVVGVTGAADDPPDPYGLASLAGGGGPETSRG